MSRKNNPRKATQARKDKQKAQRRAATKSRRVRVIDTPGTPKSGLALLAALINKRNML